MICPSCMRKCKPILFLAFIIFVFGNCRNVGKKLTGNEIIENTKGLNEYVMQDIKAAMVVATENEGQVDDTIRLSHYNAVEDFYYNRDYAPVWSDTGIFKPAAYQFLSFLDTIIYEGLLKEDYHYSQISSSRKAFQTDSIKRKDAISWAKAEILLTDAFLHIMNDLKQGKMVPDSLSWKNDTARFTTFFVPGLDSFLKGNPISAVMDSLHPGIASYKALRKQLPDFLRKIDTTHYTSLSYKDKFKESHGVGLGFMSFFTKACSYALQEFPAVNAYISNDEIIYHDYCDISIAVSAPKGLVVPVIRNAESLGMADIEAAVVDLATKAKNNKLTVEEMSGGTFTITNGGIFGSMMSTPIINIPQSAILGMHNIVDRPMAVNGQVVIKPMMYVALSYDHRIIDGRESVGFLVTVKKLLENPALLLFGKDPMDALLEI